MENYLNRAIAGEHPLPQNIKYHCKEEGKSKDDQNLKKKNVEKRTEVFFVNLISEFSSCIFGDELLRLANHTS